MNHARAIGVCGLWVTALAGVATGVAADDPLQAAYQRLHEGDRGAARRECEALVTANPSGLPDDYEHESASWPAKAGLVSPYLPH